LIGDVTNFLPLYLQVSAEKTSLEVLNQVKSIVLEAFHHHDCPFEEIVKAICPERAMDMAPLFNVALWMHNFSVFRNVDVGARDDHECDVPRAHLNINDGLNASIMFTRPLNQSATYDLRFEAFMFSDEVYFGCEYSTDLFKDETIEWLLNSYCEVLKKFVHDPQSKISELELSK
jgi:non-ribosomal peptide synthetase component F